MRPYTGKSYKEKGNVREHRLICAAVLGKMLRRGIDIHHVYGTLVICESHAYHHFLHVRQRAFEATGDVSQRKCSICNTWDRIENLLRRGKRDFCHYACRVKYNKQYYSTHYVSKRAALSVAITCADSLEQIALLALTPDQERIGKDAGVLL